MILQNPQDYYSYFADLVIKNMEAYEKAVKTVKSTYDKYIEQYKISYPSPDKVMDFLNKYNMANCGISMAYPSMASASGMLILSNSCYIGLLIEKTMTDIGMTKKDNDYLLNCLKALSDPSKLSILTSLKVSPKYATELASQLGLTSATISHHMNMLLTMHLVYVEKENGRYYFHINKDTVAEVLERVNKQLL
jgi:DNA-binding transcriptional ArsR family regulator